MADLGYAQLPVPGGGQAPTVPGDLAALALAIDRHLWQHVTDKAQRDSKYADAPLHTVVTAEDGSTWVKTSGTANVWATLYEPLPAWQSVTPATNYETGSPAAQYLFDGRQLHVRGRLVRADGTDIPTNGVTIGHVPEEYAPRGRSHATFPAVSSLADEITVGVGNIVVIADGVASSYGPPGTLVWWTQEGSGTPWVDISGSYWRD